MHRILAVISMLALSVPLLAQTPQTEAPFTTKAGLDSGSKYDILGLKLGMTAEEAEKVIYPQTHITPPTPNGREWKQGGYLVDSRAPLIGGTGFPVTLIANRDLHLMLTFVEVPRGEAKGPEMLWQIEYRPDLKTPDPLKPSKEALADLRARLTTKFGQPFPDYDDSIWSTQQLKNEYIYKKSGLTYLVLETHGELTLTNPRLASHMAEVYASHKSAPPI